MVHNSLFVTALQSGVLFLVIWFVFRLVPSLPANAKAWIWRLAFVKPLIGLLPFAPIPLRVLPSSHGHFITAPVSAPVEASELTSIVDPHPAIALLQHHNPGQEISPIFAVYVLGAVAVAAWGLRGSFRAARIVRRAELVTDEATLDMARHLLALAKVTRPARLVQSSDTESAMLVGGFRVTIVIPNLAAASHSQSDVRLMLAHEVAHLARKDLSWFGIAWVVQSLFFFSPLVWLAARCSRLDHESATDQYASHLAAVPIQTYAEMLLRTSVVVRSNTSLVPGALPMGESFSMIHRRLEAMKHFDSKPYRWRKSVVGAIALMTVGLFPVYQWAEAAPAPHSPVVGKLSPKADDVIAAKKHRKKKAVKSKQTKLEVASVKTIGWMPPQAKPRIVAIDPARSGYRPVVSTDSLQGAPETKYTDPLRAGSGSIAPSIGIVSPASRGQSTKPIAPSPRGGASAGITPELPATSAGTRDSALPSAITPTSRVGGAMLPAAISTSKPRDPRFSPTTTATGGGLAPGPIETSTRDPLSGGGSSNEVNRTPNGNVMYKFDNCNAREALQSLMRYEHLPFVIESSIQGRVTVMVEDVSFEVAFNAMLKAANATYRIEGETYYLSGK